jgi:uncharacterized damage-inducible protein DinB
MSLEPNNIETQRIAKQLSRLYKGPSWLGPSLKELLSDIDEVRARRRILPAAHTIWELVLHIAAWLSIARERLSAPETRDATAEEDWPPMAGSWPDATSLLQSEVNALEQALRAFPDDRLQQRAPATEPQLFYEMLHGVIQHSAYHAGQIALLKKN